MSTIGSSLTRREALRGPVLVGAIGLAGAGLLHFNDPHNSGSYGYCPFLLVTGVPCPGCGGLRALNDLTQFDLVGAISSNLLAVALVAALALAYVRWLPRRWRGENAPMIMLSAKAGAGVIALMVIFGAVRLTPWGTWLAP